MYPYAISMLVYIDCYYGVTITTTDVIDIMYHLHIGLDSVISGNNTNNYNSQDSMVENWYQWY